jgi:arginase
MLPLPPRLDGIDFEGVRAGGAAAAARVAVGRLTAGPSGGYWIHLDVDILDDAIMPAVDYRLPGGLSWAELESVLWIALAGDGAVGLDVTIFNPRLDPDGRIAARLTECLGRGLSARV